MLLEWKCSNKRPSISRVRQWKAGSRKIAFDDSTLPIVPSTFIYRLVAPTLFYTCTSLYIISFFIRVSLFVHKNTILFFFNLFITKSEKRLENVESAGKDIIILSRFKGNDARISRALTHEKSIFAILSPLYSTKRDTPGREGETIPTECLSERSGQGIHPRRDPRASGSLKDKLEYVFLVSF